RNGPWQRWPRGIACREIGAQQYALRADDGGEQNRIGGGDGRLGGEQKRSREQGRCRECRDGRRDRPGEPEGEPGRDQSAEEGWQPVGPDVGALAEACDGGGRRLQPVDACRLLVAGDEAEADVDEVSGLQHLLGGLGEAALVAVERRQAEEAGQPQKRAEHEQGGERTLGRGLEEPGGFRGLSDGESLRLLAWPPALYKARRAAWGVPPPHQSEKATPARCLFRF